jgi:VRR-NUC domain-containing protein/Fanconi-associated nuclease 1-like protein
MDVAKSVPAAMLTPDRPPPEDYYQNNCRVLINFVLQRYAHLLNTTEQQLLEQFLRLSDDGQRLFARLLTRKPLLRVDQIEYAEVTELEAALEELSAAGLIELNPPVAALEVLDLLRKAELHAEVENLPGSYRKSDLQLAWLDGCSEAQLRLSALKTISWLRVARRDVWDLVQLLYFGSRRHNWSSFVMRDLGMVVYEPVAMHTHQFADRAALQQTLRFQHLGDLSTRLDEHASLAQALAAELMPAVSDRFLRRRRARALMRIARWHERNQSWDEAVQVYQHIEQHPARERLVRVLHKQGDQQGVEKWLETISSAPLCEEEAQFVQRFGRRQAGYQPPTTVIEIDQAEPDIENQALDLLLRPGAWGIHAENTLFKTLTGLIYWPVIFADIPGAFTNPFQSGPNDLFEDDFAQARAEQIEALERELADDSCLVAHLHSVITAKQGRANALVYWPLLEAVSLEDLLEAVPLGDIRRLCAFMLRNLAQRRAGLPDLFIAYGKNSYELVEVKGPNDQLQPGQRVWLKHLQRLGIPARVVKLKLAAQKPS